MYDKLSTHTHTHNLHWIMAEKKTLLYLEGSSTKSVNQLQQIVVNVVHVFRWSVNECKRFLSNATWIIPAVFILWPDEMSSYYSWSFMIICFKKLKWIIDIKCSDISKLSRAVISCINKGKPKISGHYSLNRPISGDYCYFIVLAL